jgi:hypothetical protein
MGDILGENAHRIPARKLIQKQKDVEKSAFEVFLARTLVCNGIGRYGPVHSADHQRKQPYRASLHRALQREEQPNHDPQHRVPCSCHDIHCSYEHKVKSEHEYLAEINKDCRKNEREGGRSGLPIPDGVMQIGHLHDPKGTVRREEQLRS